MNLAKPDMVGHNGNMESGKKAAETVDICLKELQRAVDKVGSNTLITADHGNLEKMVDISTGTPFTQHTTNPVGVILYGNDMKPVSLRNGSALCDISPTLLKMMNVKQPSEMTGIALY